jgi:hypothetical protein
MCYYLWFGRHFSVRKLWVFWIMSTVFAFVVYILMLLSPAYGAAPMMLLVMAEPPTLFRLVMCIDLVREAKIRSFRFRMAALQLLGITGFFLTHLFNVFNTMQSKTGEKIEQEYTVPIILVVQAVFYSILNVAFYSLVKDGVFTATEEDATEGANDDSKSCFFGFGRVLHSPMQCSWETHYIYPEFVVACSEVANTFGYFLAATMLFNVTKPNFMADPIYLLYGTFHPCILLDYMPGSLFAMPMFSLGTLLFVAGALLMFIRTVLLGEVFLTTLSALTLGLTVVGGAFFVMVFPWAPAVSSVLAHSIPFMEFRAVIVLFCLVQTYVMVRHDHENKWSTSQHKVVFVLFMFLWTAILIYGLNFMLTNILRAYDLGEGRPTHIGSMPPGLERDTAIAREGITILETGLGNFFIKIPAFIAALAASFELPIFYYLSPMKKAPIAFEVTSLAWGLRPRFDPPITKPEVAAGAAQSMRFRPRSLFAMAWGNLYFWLAFAIMLTRAVYSPEELSSETWTFTMYLEKPPSSYTLAVGWMFSVPLLMLHWLLTLLHEVRHNACSNVKTLLCVMGPVVTIAVLIAHTNAIPQGPGNCPHTIVNPTTGFPTENCPETEIPCPVPAWPEGNCFSWFNGTRWFQLLFGLWMIVLAYITTQSCRRRYAEEAAVEEEADRRRYAEEAEADNGEAAVEKDPSSDDYMYYCIRISRTTVFYWDVGSALSAGILMMISAIINIHSSVHGRQPRSTKYIDYLWLFLVGLWTQFDYQNTTFYFANMRTHLPMKTAGHVPICGFCQQKGREPQRITSSQTPIATNRQLNLSLLSVKTDDDDYDEDGTSSDGTR